MTTCELFPQTDCKRMESALMPFAEDFHVKTLVLQAVERVLLESAAASGENTPGSLASFDRGSLSWKTSQRSLDGGWETFSETWPRSGMMRNGIAYRLPTLVQDSFGTEYGLWPTPNATAFKGGATVTAAWCEKPRAEQLAGLVQPCAWPTLSGSRDCGTGHGVSNGTHRNKSLGNAVVPQVPELIGRAIMSVMVQSHV